MNMRDIVDFIEQYRIKNRITQMDFLNYGNIVSLRQYKRYLQDDCKATMETILSLCEHNNLDFQDLLIQIEYQKSTQFNQLHTLYRSIVTYDFELCNKLFLLMEKESYSGKNRKYFDFCILLYNYYRGVTGKRTTKELLLKHMNYPTILEHEIMDSIDVLMICTLVIFFSVTEFNPILNIIENLLSKESIVFENGCYIYPYILVIIAKEYGRRNLNEKVVKICKIGIDYLKDSMSYFNMDYFYYYLALAYRNMGRPSDSHSSLEKCFRYVICEKNRHNYKKFNQLVEKDFNICFDDFIDEIRISLQKGLG